MTNAIAPPKTAPEPALYVGTYAKYNAGSITGKWLKLSDYGDAEEFIAACKELHKDESDPELMFQDFECFPEELYGESMSTDEIAKIYEYVDIDEDDREMLKAYIDCVGGEFSEDTLSEAQDAYQGQYNSDEDFAQSLAEDVGCIDQNVNWPYTCIDWEQAAREVMMDYRESDGYYFRA
jgi:antirestriction protein